MSGKKGTPKVDVRQDDEAEDRHRAPPAPVTTLVGRQYYKSLPPEMIKTPAAPPPTDLSDEPRGDDWEMIQIEREKEEQRKKERTEKIRKKREEEEAEKQRVAMAEIVEPPPIEDDDEFAAVPKFRQSAAFIRSKLDPILLECGIIGASEADEVEREPIAWSWEGIANDASHVEVSGPSGSGKTTLIFLLAAASASASGPVKVFGRTVTPIPEGKCVLLVEEENDQPMCVKMIRASCQMLGLNYRATIARIFLMCRTGFQPASREAEAIFAAGRKDHVWGRIFLDSRARIFTGKANVEEDQAATSRWILNLINCTQSSVWVVSHTRKGNSDDLDDVSGSQQRVAAADTVILVKGKHDKSGKVLASRVLFKKIRNGLDLDDHPSPCTFTRVKANGRYKLDWKELREDDDEDASPRERLLALLSDSTTGDVSWSVARTRTGLNTRMFNDLVAALVDEKVIIRFSKDSKGRYGKTVLLRMRKSSDVTAFQEVVPEQDEDE